MIQIKIFEGTSLPSVESTINLWLIGQDKPISSTFGVIGISLSTMELEGKIRFIALVTYSTSKKV